MCDAAEWKKSPTGLAPKPIVKNHKLRRPRRARRFPHFEPHFFRSSFDPGFHCCLNSILNLRHLAHSLFTTSTENPPPVLLLRCITLSIAVCVPGTRGQEAACLNSYILTCRIYRTRPHPIHTSTAYSSQPCPSTRNLLSTPSAEIHARRHHLP